MENSTSFSSRIVKPFNCLDWREDIYIVLHNKVLYKVTMGKEVEPQHALEKLKYLNKLDGAFGFIYSYLQGVTLPP